DCVSEFFTALFVDFVDFSAFLGNPLSDLIESFLAGVIAERSAEDVHPFIESPTLVFMHFYLPCSGTMNDLQNSSHWLFLRPAKFQRSGQLDPERLEGVFLPLEKICQERVLTNLPSLDLLLRSGAWHIDLSATS